MLRSFLLAPCLLICLACVKPLPNSFGTGMTSETVLENFGAPEAMETKPGGVESWTYTHNDVAWPMFLFPPLLLSIPITAAWPGVPWDLPYVRRRSLVLHFDDGRLAQWELPVSLSAYCREWHNLFLGCHPAAANRY